MPARHPKPSASDRAVPVPKARTFGLSCPDAYALNPMLESLYHKEESRGAFQLVGSANGQTDGQFSSSGPTFHLGLSRSCEDAD